MNKRKKLYLIGAGDLGREVETWLKTEQIEKEFEIAGFLDKNKYALKGFPSQYTIIGEENNIKFTENDYVLITVANSKVRENIYNRIKSKVKFYSFISKNAFLGNFNEMGDNIIVCPGTYITTNVKIGNCVFFNVGCKIGHDVVIGEFTTINPDTNIGGDCVIGKHVFLGTNCTIHPRKNIGDNSVVGLGSVVIKHVKPNQTVFGVPAKILRMNN